VPVIRDSGSDGKSLSSPLGAPPSTQFTIRSISRWLATVHCENAVPSHCTPGGIRFSSTSSLMAFATASLVVGRQRERNAARMMQLRQLRCKILTSSLLNLTLVVIGS